MTSKKQPKKSCFFTIISSFVLEQPSVFTIYVLVGIILWKELSFRYVFRKGKKTNSLSLQADAWHHRSDAISSLIALLGIGACFLLGPQFSNADDWAAILASLFIVYNAYTIFLPALGEVLDEHNHHELIEKIREMENKVEGVMGIEKCLVRKTGMTYFVDLHLEVDGRITVSEGHNIAHNFKDFVLIRIPDISYILIHIEPKRV